MSESQSNSDTHPAVSASQKPSMEVIIENVRGYRNDLIKELLKDGKIQSHFMVTYKKTISPVKIEFIRRELKTLSVAPVDLIHYAALIKAIKKDSNVELVAIDPQIFYDELDVIFRRYNY